MTFFGIKNSSSSEDPDFLAELGTCKNLLKKNSINQVVMLKKIRPNPLDFLYSKVPLIYDHFDTFCKRTDVYDTMEDGSVITNRHIIRILALNHACCLKMYPVFKNINGRTKKFYILEDEKCNTSWPLESYKIGVGIEATLHADWESSTHTTYRHSKFTVKRETGKMLDIHFTSQIDLFDDKDDPLEVKSVKCRLRNSGQRLSKSFIYKSAIQCKLGNVEKLVIGFHEYPTKHEIYVEQFKIDELCDEKMKANIDATLERMKIDVGKMVDEYERNQYLKGVNVYYYNNSFKLFAL